jgi:putative aldouronate transport system substrate-binding protein
MKRIVALTALLLSVLLLLATGCQPAVTTVPTTAAPTTAKPTATSGTAASTLAPVQLTWFMMIGGAQPDQDEVFAAFSDYVESQINATVEIVSLEWGTYDAKLQAASASGEAFDITWISDWMGVKYADFANKGAIIPLDDLLEEYAPNAKAFIADKFWDRMKVGGKIYGVPCYQTFYRQNGMWIKKDLADKYGFKPADFKTYKDLEPFYDAVLAGESDVVPLAVNSGYMYWFLDGTGPAPDRGIYKNLGYGTTVYANNPKVVVDEYESGSFVQQDVLASLTVARAWYEKQYVRADLLSIQDLNAEIRTQRYASGFTMLKPGVESEIADTYGFDVYTLALGRPVLSGVTATELAVSVTSKNPERAVMLIDLLMSDVYAYNLIANGIEGKHYVKTGDARISRVENNGYQPGMDWALGNTFLAYLVPGQADDLNDQVKAGNDAAEPDFMPDWNFNTEKVKNECAASDPLWSEYGNPLYAGVLDPAVKYPEYIDKALKAGHAHIVAEIQAQFTAYLASQP